MWPPEDTGRGPCLPPVKAEDEPAIEILQITVTKYNFFIIMPQNRNLIFCAPKPGLSRRGGGKSPCFTGRGLKKRVQIHRKERSYDWLHKNAFFLLHSLGFVIKWFEIMGASGSSVTGCRENVREIPRLFSVRRFFGAGAERNDPLRIWSIQEIADFNT